MLRSQHWRAARSNFTLMTFWNYLMRVSVSLYNSYSRICFLSASKTINLNRSDSCFFNNLTSSSTISMISKWISYIRDWKSLIVS